MKAYRVKVTELHVGYAWVEAESKEEAAAIGWETADVLFDSTQDISGVDERDFIPDGER